jgi:hypothetical protein
MASNVFRKASNAFRWLQMASKSNRMQKDSTGG